MENKVNFTASYAVYQVTKLSNPYMPEDFISRFGLKAYLPLNRCVIAHNGTLTPQQHRAFGRNPFQTAAGMKTDKMPKPANPFPCIIRALQISQETGAPLDSLTIGDMDKFNNRSVVSSLMNSFASWYASGESMSDDLFPMWDFMLEMDPNLNVESTVFPGIESDYKNWLKTQSLILEPTEALIQERNKSGWGEW